jgi:nitrous oxidase accessory protein
MRMLLLTLFCGLPTAIASGAELHVGVGQSYATVTSAIAAASTGDVVMVHAGIYQEGNLRVNKSITLTGMDHPVLDGADQFEVVTITAPNVTLSGFDVRNSGSGSLEDMAGIKIAGTDHVTVEGNRIQHCNFSIYLAKAEHCRVLTNEIQGISAKEQDTGNGIHIWSCNHITVCDNQIRGHRDGIYLEFGTESTIERNMVENNLRYGLHFMFSHGNVYRGNSFQHNGAGVAVMYSRDVEMSSNYFGFNWGSASYGLLLKDMAGGRICDNTFDRNSIGISMHGSDRMTIERNQFSENGWAIQVQGSCSNNHFGGNNFSGNSFDVAADGELDNDRFENNYWDKYEGYDLNRDGFGDVPFRPVSLYAVVVGRIPSSVLLLRSPIVQLLDQAEKAFPVITPERVLDETPATHPHPLPSFHPQP